MPGDNFIKQVRRENKPGNCREPSPECENGGTPDQLCAENLAKKS